MFTYIYKNFIGLRKCLLWPEKVLIVQANITLNE